MAEYKLESEPCVIEREMFEKHRKFLEEHVDPDFGLLDKLRQNGALSKRDVAQIKANYTIYERNSLLLNFISIKEKYGSLTEALTDTNQSHIVNYLKANGEYSSEFAGNWPLLEKEMAILEANQEFLVDNLSMLDLLDRLYANGVISKRQRDFISSKPTSHEKNEAFVEILSIHSLSGYWQTIRCLQQSNQRHIAIVLDHGGGGKVAQKESPKTISMEVTKQLNPTQKQITSSMDKSFQSQDSASDVGDTSEILKMIIDEKLIGKGSYGDVYGPFKWREQECVVKRIAYEANLLTDAKRKNLEEKRVLWTSQSHENLTKILTVSLIERSSSMAVLYIFIEYLAGDTLRKTLDEDGPLPNSVVSDWAKQIDNGMSYLHERNIVHRDLKSNNVLLTKSYHSNAYDEITLKIGDFDEMREHSGTVTMTLIGTYGWMAPEVLLHDRFSKSSDVWSYGVIVWEMLTGDLPHKTLSHHELIKKAEAGELALSLPESIPEAMNQLVKYCFRLENNNRPTFCDIKDLLGSCSTVTKRGDLATRSEKGDDINSEIVLSSDPVTRTEQEAGTHSDIVLSGDLATRSEKGANDNSEIVLSSDLVTRTEQGVETNSGIVLTSDISTRSEQITGINSDRVEMEPKTLDGPYAHHAYIGFAKENKEIVFKLRRQLENDGVSCFPRATDVAVQNSILDGVNKSQKCLLLVTPDYLKDKCYQMETEEVLQKAERFSRDMVMILKTSYDHEVPEKLQGFKQILITPETLSDEKKMAHLIDDIVREPYVSLADMTKQSVGYVSAFHYYYDYLRLILPDFKKRLLEGTLGNEQELMEKAIKKMLIIMPESCFCPPSMTSNGKIEFTGKYVVRVVCRAGNENRDYKTSLYKLIARDNSEYYFVAEFATPLLTMYESYFFGLSGMTRDQLYVERDLFYFTLKSLLSHPDNSDCNDQFKLLYWSDPKTEKTSRLTLYEFLYPVLQYELEEERFLGPYMYDCISSPRPNRQELCSFINVNVSGSNPARVYDEVASYPMDKRPRGICLIINIENFDNLSRRRGSARDAEVLENLFKVLHFDVQIHKDITEQTLEAILLTTCSLNHSEYNALVCCILTHGRLGVIYTSDGKPVEILKLVEFFTDKNCPSLKSKPKMFFIQACQRGDYETEQAGNANHPVRRHIGQSASDFKEILRHDDGSAVEPRTEDSTTNHSLLLETQQGLEKLVIGIPPNAVSEIKKEAPMVPAVIDGVSDKGVLGTDAQDPGFSTSRYKAALVPGHPDFLMSYSTLPGSISYRDTLAGSLYVQALDECLRKRWEMDRVLKSVSSCVREKLALRSEQDGVTERFQLPFHLTSGMDRTIYL